MKIYQLTPYFQPGVSGVGDFARALGLELLNAHQFSSDYVVFHGDAMMEEHVLGSSVKCLGARTANFPEALVPAKRLILHYVGYGYQKRGCPTGLLYSIRRWKREDPKATLITFFHELYATGKPWQSSFWTSLLQKRICSELAEVSDWIVTNRRASREVLIRMTGRDDIIALPVFSNVGEPDERVRMADRRARLVIFGGSRWRSTALGCDATEIAQVCRKWGIEEVLEIGGGETGSADLGVPLRKLGRLAAKGVSSCLSQSRLGFLSYSSSDLEKSGIYSAYAAHGVVPVLPKRSLDQNSLGVLEGLHYLGPDCGDGSDGFLERVSEAVFEWYQGHRIADHAAAIAELLRKG